MMFQTAGVQYQDVYRQHAPVRELHGGVVAGGQGGGHHARGVCQRSARGHRVPHRGPGGCQESCEELGHG